MATGPPILTPTSQMLVRWTDAVAGWSTRRALLTTILVFMAACSLDYLTGIVSVGFMYLGATAFAVWALGQHRGLAVSVAGLMAGALIEHVERAHPASPQTFGFVVEGWNICARLLSFGLIAVVTSGLRGVLTLERWRGSHDGLTGVLNRGAFKRRMGIVARQARAAGSDVLFAYMDLDGFKAVNDRNGHSAGDRVLGAFASAADTVIRSTDLFARFGGDEFAALLIVPPHIDGALVATLVHERLNAILLATGFDVTCSMGAVLLAKETVAVDDAVIEQADALMYEAKRAGKNGLRVARSDGMNTALRAAYPLIEDQSLEDLLNSVDVADRRHRWMDRRAA